MKMPLPSKLASDVAIVLWGVGAVRGDTTVAVLAAIIVWYSFAFHRALTAAIHADAWARSTKVLNDELLRHNAQLVAQDLWRQQEYDRLVAEARSKIGQAEMIIRGTRR